LRKSASLQITKKMRSKKKWSAAGRLTGGRISDKRLGRKREATSAEGSTSSPGQSNERGWWPGAVAKSNQLEKIPGGKNRNQVGVDMGGTLIGRAAGRCRGKADWGRGRPGTNGSSEDTGTKRKKKRGSQSKTGDENEPARNFR